MWIIGSYISIIKSTQDDYVGIYGEVVYETKNMVWIRSTQHRPHKIVKLPKDTLLEMKNISNNQIFTKEFIRKRPEDRLK